MNVNVKKAAPKKRVGNNKQGTLSQEEKRMDEISSEMALYFANKLPTVRLAEWVASSHGYWKGHGNEIPTFGKNQGFAFIHDIGWQLLPGLIKCNSNEERIKFGSLL